MEKTSNIENLNKQELLNLDILLDKQINELLEIKKCITNKLNNKKNQININININIKKVKKNILTTSIIKKSLDKNNILYTKIMTKEELYNLLKKHKIIKSTYNMLKELKESEKEDRTYVNDSESED
jgi:hypothetical protein